jgi:pyruvate/2-oxoglutarate dehydrogenase complex dihydrolipoamide acyltransferase (E2) component
MKAVLKVLILAAVVGATGVNAAVPAPPIPAPESGPAPAAPPIIPSVASPSPGVAPLPTAPEQPAGRQRRRPLRRLRERIRSLFGKGGR